MGTIHKISATTTKGSEYILSDASTDRYQDRIELSAWKLDNFRRNPIALAYHDSRFPIGTWENIAVRNGALRGHLKLAPVNTSARCNEIRRLIEANVLRGVSVGFTSLRAEPIGNSGGVRYLEAELVECSLVTLPANSHALQVLDAPPPATRASPPDRVAPARREIVQPAAPVHPWDAHRTWRGHRF